MTNNDPDRLYLDELRDRLRDVVGRPAWEAGDIAAEIDTTYGGGELQSAAEHAGIDYGTLREYRRIAQVFESANRLANLSWKHHQVVAARPDRLEWLNRAAAGEWSVRVMLAEIDLAEAKAADGAGEITAAEAEAKTQEIRLTFARVDLGVVMGLLRGVPPSMLDEMLHASLRTADLGPELYDIVLATFVRPRIDGLFGWPTRGLYRLIGLDMLTWPERPDYDADIAAAAARLRDDEASRLGITISED